LGFLGDFGFGMVYGYAYCRHSVGKSAAVPMGALAPADFDPREMLWTRFPPEGSMVTPPHPSVEFRWKDYCPVVFRCVFAYTIKLMGDVVHLILFYSIGY
jgi:hypothetical protein